MTKKTGSKSLLEVNTRVWLKQFASKDNPNPTLADIPRNYLRELNSMGFDAIWLMGVWQSAKDIPDKFVKSKTMLKEYVEALPDLKSQDIIGSPYAIDDYILNPTLGTLTELRELKEDLNILNIKLILDFIPNHFSLGSRLLLTNPEIFLTATENEFKNDPTKFFEFSRADTEPKYFAHGKDPNFPSWQDTVQINYTSSLARDLMTQRLVTISDYCNGVRCDMAMLVTKQVFLQSWGHLVATQQSLVDSEFWTQAIKRVRLKYPDFLFLAEVYWGLEQKMLNLGFDYTYNKELYDSLLNSNLFSIKKLINRQVNENSIHFIENHDEARSYKAFGSKKYQPAAVIISTLPGLSLYYDGQFEGKQIRLPVQLGREAKENPKSDVQSFYSRIIEIKKSQILKKGYWTSLHPFNIDEDTTYNNLLAWMWQLENTDFLALNDKTIKAISTSLLTVVNYSAITSKCFLKLNLRSEQLQGRFVDLLNGNHFSYQQSWIEPHGLYIELRPWQSHILLL